MDDTRTLTDRSAGPRTRGRFRGVLRRLAPGRTVRVVLDVLAGVFVLVAVLGLWAHYRTPTGTTGLAISAGTPYLMLGAIVGLVLFLAAREWIAVVVALALTAWCVIIQAPLFVAADAPHDARNVVSMTANLHLGLADPDAVVRAVRDHHVDVLMLEELTGEEQQRLVAAGLNKVLPFHESQPNYSALGTGLWSRWRMTDAVKQSGFSFALITARIAVPGVHTAPTAVALHMAGPVPDITNWRHDMARLPGFLRALPSDGSVVVGGDFNSTPDITQFRKVLGGGYRDAAEQAGAGVTATYPADRWYPPLIAIDHVLTRDAVGRSADTVHIPGSDHRALFVTVALPRTA